MIDKETLYDIVYDRLKPIIHGAINGGDECRFSRIETEICDNSIKFVFYKPHKIPPGYITISFQGEKTFIDQVYHKYGCLCFITNIEIRDDDKVIFDPCMYTSEGGINDNHFPILPKEDMSEIYHAIERYFSTHVSDSRLSRIFYRTLQLTDGFINDAFLGHPFEQHASVMMYRPPRRTHTWIVHSMTDGVMPHICIIEVAMKNGRIEIICNRNNQLPIIIIDQRGNVIWDGDEKTPFDNVYPGLFKEMATFLETELKKFLEVSYGNHEDEVSE